MIAVWKREFKAYFDNMLGYVIVAVMALFFGLYFTVYNIQVGYPFYAYALYGVLSYLSILIPLLTMRSLSEERKSKSDQLLLTAPVSVTKIVMGKYLAMLSVYALPILMSCIYPLIITMTGDAMKGVNVTQYLLTDYATIFAFFLLGASYIAIGMFLSSVTESPIIAALLSFGVLFLMQIMSGIAVYVPVTEGKNALIFVAVAFVVALLIYKMTQSAYAAFVVFAISSIVIAVLYITKKSIFYSAVANILNAIPYENTLSNFIYSIFDVTAIVTYLSVSVFAVFLTVQSIQKRRYS